MNKNISNVIKKLKDERLKSIGKLLKNSREQSKTPRSIISRKMGLSSSQHLSNVERGVTPPSPKTFLYYIEYAKIDKVSLAIQLASIEREYYTKMFSLSEKIK